MIGSRTAPESPRGNLSTASSVTLAIWFKRFHNRSAVGGGGAILGEVHARQP